VESSRPPGLQASRKPLFMGMRGVFVEQITQKAEAAKQWEE